MFAVLACSDPSRVTDPTQYPGAPPHGLASSGHRMAPLKKSLRNGYDEIEIETKGDRLLADADRVRKKLAAWKNRPDARMWLSARSYGLAQRLYLSIDPDLLCQRHLVTK
jgi:hypothetical protein